jgi:hypothetical protein
MKFVPKLAPRKRGRLSLAEHQLIDWEGIRRLWEGGFSSAEISRRYPISKRMVQIKGQKEWDKEKRQAALEGRGKMDPYPVDADLNDLPEARVYVRADADAFMAMLARIEDPRWPETTVLPDLAVALEGMAKGLTFVLACDRAGLAAGMVNSMRKAEPRLDALFRRARSMAAQALVEKVMEAADRDWRAGAWLLERGSSKEEWQQTETISNALTIEVKVDRGEDVMRDAGIKIVDVEPNPAPARIEYKEVADADMDPGLHTLAETESVPRPEGPADPLRGRGRRR